MKVKLNLLTDTDMLLMVEKVSTKVEYILLLKKYQACKNWSKKKLFAIRYTTMFFSKHLSGIEMKKRKYLWINQSI